MLGSLFGGDGGSTNSESVSKVELPDWLDNASQFQVRTAQKLQKQPYQTYGGPRIAPFTDDDNAAFEINRAARGGWMPAHDEAGRLAGLASQAWTPETSSEYMNPYAQNVTDIMVREAARDDDIARKSRNARAVAAGAFGGAQHGVMEAEAQRNLGQRLDDIRMTGAERAYDNAYAKFAGDRGAQLSAGNAYAGLANQYTDLAGKDVAALATAGTAQRDMGQRNLDLAYQDFMNQQNYPWLQQQRALPAITSVPHGSTTTTTGTTTATPGTGSAIGQIAGLGLAGASLYSGWGR